MTIRILLVDDHQILREGIRRGFESAGHEVVAKEIIQAFLDSIR